MKDIDSILHSEYIIDGIRMEVTPAQMLGECMPYGTAAAPSREIYPPIVDEPADPAPGTVKYSPGLIPAYLEALKASGGDSGFPAEFSGAATRAAIARALIGTLWKKGHFSLEDIGMRISWEWDCAPVGSMAAFYFSAEAVSEYLFDLGIKLSGYSITCAQGADRMGVDCVLSRFEPPAETSEEDDGEEMEDGEERTFIECRDTVCSEQEMPSERQCPEYLVPEKKSWLIYIPFDTCPFKLGGSLLSRKIGSNGDNAPEIKDPDYFIDCFEVLKELIEDGVVISGTTVSEGGLAAAADRMCGRTGCSIDIKGIEAAYNEQDRIRILFGETPGVIVQILDSDYDYVDAQLLLQEIAYYPLGHPDPDIKGISISESGRPDVFSILEALLNNPSTSEGED